MLQVELSASVREKFGKGAMHRLREEGMTPAILYGLGTESLPIQLETKSFYQKLLKIHGRNAVVTLSLGKGKTHHVVIKDVQADPVRDTIIHADFYKIDIKKPKGFEVEINFTGTPKGVDLGGILMIEQRTVRLEAPPLDIPDSCSLDISGLGIGDKLSFSALDIEGDVRMVSEGDHVCVRVDAPSKEKEEGESLEVEAEEAGDTAEVTETTES